jgi:hypothetical protein
MRNALLVGLVVVAAVPALAGGNPGVRIYIDFDPPNYVFEYAPAPSELFRAYVCLDQLTEGLMSVGGGPCHAGDCPQVPVARSSCGTIKSLHR